MKKLLIPIIILLPLISSAVKTDSLTQLFQQVKGEQKLTIAYKLANYWYDQKSDSTLFFLDFIINNTEKRTADTIRGYALKLKGNLYIFEKTYSKAASHYTKALEIFENTNNTKGTESCLNNLGIVMLRQNKFDKAINYMNESIKFARSRGDELSVAKTLHNLGYIYELKSENAKALEQYLKALQIKRNFSDSASVAATLNNIGNIYLNYKDYKTALKYYEQSLTINRYLKDSSDIATTYYNIGRIYKDKRQLEESLEHFLAALNIYKALKKEDGMANVQNAIGNLFSVTEKYEKAGQYYYKALDNTDSLKNKAETARIYNNLAEIYEIQNNLKKAKQLYEDAIHYFNQTELFEEKVVTYRNYADILISLNNFEKAKEYFAKAIDLARKKGNNHQLALSLSAYSRLYYAKNDYSTALKVLGYASEKAIKTNSFLLKKGIYKRYYVNYKALNQYKNALYYFEKYQAMQDSVINEKNLQNLEDIEKKYQLKQKEKEILLLSSQNKLHEMKNTAQQIKLKNVTLTRNFALGGGFLLLLLVLISFYAFLSKRRANRKLSKFNAEILEQKEEISAQRDEIEAQLKQIGQQNNTLARQQQNITDSITYAQYIQKSIFPSEDFLQLHFKEHFIFYKPKDIVSGDFYFGEAVNNHIYIAAVDCTGHGVPGAFMSLLAYNALRISVVEKQLTEPAQILENIDQQIRESTHASPDIAGNGMDIVLIKINKKTQLLETSGAKRPLIIFRDNELHEIPSTKRSIGSYRFQKEKPFKQTQWQLAENDILYMFTDGFIDQFGGQHRKKFKSHHFKNKLQEIQNMQLSTQKNYLIRTFEEWKGKNEQIDDILVLGIKI